MSKSSRPASTSRPILRSLVVRNPASPLVVGLFALGMLLLPLAAWKAAAGNRPRATAAGLLGLGLLLPTAGRVLRRPRPLLLTSTADALRLEPPDGPRPGQAAEVIPLASITAYRYWLRLLRYRGFAQYHLRLELADGRVLHLADCPGPPPNAPTGTVRLDAVARRLARRRPTGPTRRPSFYLTRPARVLLWGSWVAVAAGALLLALGYPAGTMLLFPGAGYWASYYLGRGAAEVTA